MPSKAAHLAVAAEHKQTLNFLLPQGEDHLRWVVTIAFYRALHIIEAVFAGDPAAPVQHTDDHTRRNQILRTQRRYTHLWKHYHPLFNASLIARYLRVDDNSTVYDEFAAFMDLATVQDTVLNHHLHQIERSAAKLLGDPSVLGGS